jgi:hypothetical protein
MMKPGTKLKSAVCSTEVMVIRGGAEAVACGRVPMAQDRAAELLAINRAFAKRTKVGKRYTDAAGTVELLCLKAGQGSLSICGAALHIKAAKPLPSSD